MSSALEKLGNFKSELGDMAMMRDLRSTGSIPDKPVVVDEQAAELAYIDEHFDKATPQGAFLTTLHGLGYKVVERDEDGEFQQTEFADMLLADGDNLVIAGAGSGKTTALVFKIMRDIITGETMHLEKVNGQTIRKMDNIFVGTFLRSGADELQATVRSWADKLRYRIDVNSIHFGTLHSEFYKVLSECGVPVKLIGDQNLIRKCLQRAVDTIGIRREDGRQLRADDYETISAIVTYYRNRLNAERYTHPACMEYRLFPSILDNLVKAFAQNRSKENVLDFEDLQETLYKYLYITPNKQLQEKVATRYSAIYLDEFQDTSEIQYAILKFYARGRLYCNRGGAAAMQSYQDILKSRREQAQEFAKRHNVVRIGMDGQVFTEDADKVQLPPYHDDAALLTGKATRGKIVAIGDDDQCFPSGTMVLGVDGKRPIEQFKVGDSVLSYDGEGFTEQRVLRVRKKAYHGDMVRIVTNTGRVLHCTPEHILFTRVPDSDKGVYLSYTKDTGFSVGSWRDGAKNWLLKICVSDEERTETIEIYRQKYQFDNKNGAVTQLQGAKDIVEQEHLSLVYPSLPSTFSFNELGIASAGDADEYGVMFARGKDSMTATQLHDETLVDFGDMDRLFSELGSPNKATPLFHTLQYAARLGEHVYAFTPSGMVKVGMYVPVRDKHNNVKDEEIVSVSFDCVTCEVYDLDIAKTHNYIVDGVLVHNCIYSWRGSTIDVMCDYYREDFAPKLLQLSKNYRCPSNILNPIIPSISKNAKRYPKNLRASREGGEFHAYHFSGITPMLMHLKQQIDEDLKNRLDVAIMCRTNFDGVVPAFLLELDGRYPFRVSSKAMTLNSDLPKSIIECCRLFTDRASDELRAVLKLIAPKNEAKAVDLLCRRLQSDKAMGRHSTIWNLDERDLDFSCPGLFKVIRMLKTVYMPDGKKRVQENEIQALHTLYFYLLSERYDDNGSYAIKVRSYIECVLYLLSTKEFTSCSEFFEEVTDIRERLQARTKCDKAKISIATVHEFKGKERSSIYIWNDSAGVFPPQKADLSDSMQIDEERKVHYIACTRASAKCVIYALRGKHSMFLDEMDCEVTDPTIVQGVLKKTLRQKSSNSTFEDSSNLGSGFDDSILEGSFVKLPDVINVAENLGDSQE